jgi:hypothetical protein
MRRKISGYEHNVSRVKQDRNARRWCGEVVRGSESKLHKVLYPGSKFTSQ